MNKVIFYVLLLAAIAVKISVPQSVQSCNNVRSIRVKYNTGSRSYSDGYSEAVLSDCINNVSLNTDSVINLRIYCRRVPRLPKLDKKVISDLPFLLVVVIDGCGIKAIEPEAFSNVPRLDSIYIIGNPIKTIVSGVFNIIPSLAWIRLIRTEISFIEDHAFANLSKLNSVRIVVSDLEYMKREWFTNTSNINYFAMSDNKIRKIPFGMFHGWKKLNELILTNNVISVIEGPLFKNNAPNIDYVDLSENRLNNTLPPNTIPDTVAVRELIL